MSTPRARASFASGLEIGELAASRLTYITPLDSKVVPLVLTSPRRTSQVSWVPSRWRAVKASVSPAGGDDGANRSRPRRAAPLKYIYALARPAATATTL